MMAAKYSVFVFVSTAISCYCLDLEPLCEYSRGLFVPKLIYNQLACVPEYAENNCIEEFKCPHTNRPQDTCYFNKKAIKINEKIGNENSVDAEIADCSCTESLDFSCPEISDGCPESWVEGYPKPGCYLRNDFSSQCATEEICPPFEEKFTCKVGDKTYKEGEQFSHPTDFCAQCICDKGFNERYEAPFCQSLNCTESLLRNHKEIMNFCAPLYTSSSCCPNSWICPQKGDQYHPNPIPSAKDNPNLKCRFGTKVMPLGDYFVRKDGSEDEITCECILPPFLYCTVYAKDLRTYNN